MAFARSGAWQPNKGPIFGAIGGLRPVNEKDLEIWNMVELPGKKYATARVYHIPWQASTHGKAEQVAVHQTLHDNPTVSVGHF
ncbi:unnamed protein product [Rotaria sp. Silwood2]|nr:unnamed protein product [Rotaria sp. Silwood2]CAF3459017.1 unnamed protein product [Rotaria sp. Silwood2]CAF4588232.1 unnamed protein product [Rotaria sp. Silwood2]CAF4600900.1 unnamed protein product [Rotaria sp. Silwood2]